MSAKQGLGDLFNLATSATTGVVRANLENAAGITIVMIGATSGNVDISEQTAASGGTNQILGGAGAGLALTYFTQNNGVWTKRTGTGAAVCQVVGQTGGLLAVYVPAVALSDGFKYIAASHAPGSFVYILHGLEVHRDPVNLKAVTA